MDLMVETQNGILPGCRHGKHKEGTFAVGLEARPGIVRLRAAIRQPSKFDDRVSRMGWLFCSRATEPLFPHIRQSRF